MFARATGKSKDDDFVLLQEPERSSHPTPLTTAPGAAPPTGLQAEYYTPYETPQTMFNDGHGNIGLRDDRTDDPRNAKRYTMRNLIAIVLCAIVGCVLGGVLHDVKVSDEVFSWVQLPGQLYLQAIQCVVVPMVFVNAIVAMADLTHAQEAKQVGVRVMVLFMVLTLLCIVEGIGMGFLTRSVLGSHKLGVPKSKQAVFQISCSNNQYLEELADHSISCTGNATSASTQFVVKDVNKALVVNNDVSSATVLDNLLTVIHTIIPANIMAALVKNTLMSIVAFAIPTGITLAKSFQGPIQLNPLLEFLREINDSLLMMTNMVLRFTPLAVLSLLSGGFGKSYGGVTTDSPITMTLWLCGLFAVAIVVHMFVIMPIIARICSSSSSFRVIKQMVPTYIYSLGCTSSTAALPVAMNCLEMGRSGSNRVMFFTMSLGASIHKHGTAIYLPMMVFYLAEMSSLSSELGGGQIAILVLASLLGAIGAAPVPGGSLAMLSTVWGIVLPKHDLPPMLVTLTVADVLLDRLVTMCNIHGSAVVTRIVEDKVTPAEDAGMGMGQFYAQ